MKSWAGIGEEECLLCDAECESVSHVLWDCPAYASIRSPFMLELRRELGDRFEHFQSLDCFEKLSYIIVCVTFVARAFYPPNRVTCLPNVSTQRKNVCLP